MAAAAFLISDAHMPAKNVTVYEMLDSTGGSLDAPSDRGDGYYRNSGRGTKGACKLDVGWRMPGAGLSRRRSWKASLGKPAFQP